MKPKTNYTTTMTTLTELTCRTCGATKPLDQFKRRSLGYDRLCKVCAAAAVRNSRAKEPKETPKCRICGIVESLGDGRGNICGPCYSQQQSRRQRGLEPLPNRPDYVGPKPGPTRTRIAIADQACPVCGVTQREHWKCAKCDARGHILGRGTALPHLCGWCEETALKDQEKAA